MPVFQLVKSNIYKDSVTLMRLSEALVARPDVHRATLLMGTAANKRMLAEGGLLGGTLAQAGPDDLMMAIEVDDPAQFEALTSEFERLLAGAASRTVSARCVERPRSLAAARARLAEANLALISVPGPYAAAEAAKALRAGLNVFLFSDNVPLAEEKRLKALAERKGLLVMGPDCGTAIINGIPLGFANAVRRGPIGVIGASGTGTQEVTCQIHRLGSGISQAIGTGGRDLSDDVGGVTTRAALRLLAKDPETAVIVVLSKPPSLAIAAEIEAMLRQLGQPSVALFFGGPTRPSDGPLHWAADLEEAARTAVTLAGDRPAAPAGADALALAQREHVRHAASQRYLRGLYSGGTFAYEAQVVWRRAGLEARSNAPLEARLALADARSSVGHTAVDLGDGAFTVGRPHPMIDPTYRSERMRQEALDPTTAVVVLDVVLGTGAHDDPAGALAPAIREAKAAATAAGRHLSVVASLCGTEADHQGLAHQAATLRQAGVLLASGSTVAAHLAALCLGNAGAAGK